MPVGVGAMAAIVGLDEAGVTQACEEAAQGEVVSPANLNGAGQIVIAGPRPQWREPASGRRRLAQSERFPLLSARRSLRPDETRRSPPDA